MLSRNSEKIIKRLTAEIIKYAKDDSEKLLRRALGKNAGKDERYSADEKYKAINRAVVALAKQNNIKWVRFLIKHYSAYKNEAAYGYAVGGHSETVYGMVRNGEVNGDPIDMSYVAGGYAESGKKELAATLEMMLSGGKVDPQYVIQGYRKGGFEEKADALELKVERESSQQKGQPKFKSSLFVSAKPRETAKNSVETQFKMN